MKNGHGFGYLIAAVVLILTSAACVCQGDAASAIGRSAVKNHIIKAGTAWIDITPSKPITIAGQMSVRYGEYKHDPLTVNAVVFEQDGKRVALVSCDLVGLPGEFIADVQASCEKELGMPAASVVIGCTHSHVAPCTFAVLPGTVEPEFMSGLHDLLVSAVKQATADLEVVDLYAGKGFVEQMGFNRRGLHGGEGKADMYWGSWKEGFEKVEGPRDGEVGVIFARNAKGDLKVVIPNFSTHPNSVESESFYSADIVGAVRSFIRRNLGDKVGVVYLTGAAGNTAPVILDNNKDNLQPWRDEEGLKRSGLYLGSEIVKTIEGVISPMRDPIMKFEHTAVNIPIRPWPKDFDPSTLKPTWRDYYTPNLKKWPEMMKGSPEPVNINVLRLGDAVICTNPGELFVEFGLDIKKISPASVTLISELTDGFVGYIPTERAFKHGGYETLNAESSKLARSAGATIVKTTARLLDKTFAE